MWDQSRLIALFPQDVDIAEAVATASAILGMEPPTYEVPLKNYRVGHNELIIIFSSVFKIGRVFKHV